MGRMEVGGRMKKEKVRGFVVDAIVAGLGVGIAMRGGDDRGAGEGGGRGEMVS